MCQCTGGAVAVDPSTGMPMPDTGTSTTVDPTVTDPVITPEVQAYDDLYACNIQTGWLGDSLCITAPDPADGFQLHYGPSDYDNPDEINRFIVAAGAEIDDELPMTTPNTTSVLYQEYHIRLRPGTHHMILWANDSGGSSITGITGFSGRYMLGAQGALDDAGGHYDRPPPEGLAAENEGLGYTLAANTPIQFNMHYVNTREEPILREGWVNFHYADPANVTEIADPITFWGALGLSIAPGEHKNVGATCAAPTSGPVRALAITGHMHAHGLRFSAWLNSASGRELIYEGYNWAEPTLMVYDTLHQNPAPDPSAYLDGGHSGILSVNPGDSIDYECEFQNDTDATLTFGNHTYTAEMCLLFGSYAPSTGGPWSCVSY